MKKLVIGNLKMNLLSMAEREHYLDWMKKELTGKKINDTEIVLCPPFVHLEAFSVCMGKKVHPVKSSLMRGAASPQFNRVKIGAQNMFSETKGSYTGEISPLMLKNMGCEYVIIGHSERKRYFAENNAEISLKMVSAIKNNLKPILCVGETKVERESGVMHTVVESQIKEALANVSRTKAEQIIIAYEPVWAVGTDEIPNANDIMEAKVLIKKILSNMFGKKYAEQVRILYGGSVNPKTVAEICLNPGMDGALVGRESLLPNEFIKIAQIINKQI